MGKEPSDREQIDSPIALKTNGRNMLAPRIAFSSLVGSGGLSDWRGTDLHPVVNGFDGKCKSLVVVVPTFNEGENIALLVPRLEAMFAGLPNVECRVVVADDNSPDNTAAIALQSSHNRRRIHISAGHRNGLGNAYLRGFEHVITKLNADVIIMMDADLSHPPELIPSFIDAINEGNDVVIGSRYVAGGGTPDWSLHRRMLSRMGNIVAREVGGLRGVRDCTSGFRAIRISQLSKIHLDELHSRGYAFLTTLLYELSRNGAMIKEIPLVFRDRELGVTKLCAVDLLEFALNAMKLRLKSSERLIKFGIVGCSGILVNLGILFCLVEFLAVEKRILAPAISVEISIISNFFLNDRWTFKRFRRSGKWHERLAKFQLTALTGFVLNLGIYNVVLSFASTLVGGYDYLLAQTIAIGVVFAWNYLISCRWTWNCDKVESLSG